MNKSFEDITVHQCVNKVMSSLAKKGIGKDQKNKFDNYNFRGIDDVYNALAIELSAAGLNIYPNVKELRESEKQSDKGKALFYKTVTVEYTLVSKYDGSNITVSTYGEAMDRGDKAVNKAMSAAYKNMAFEVFCIPVEGQDSESDSPSVAYDDKDARIIANNIQNALNVAEKREDVLGAFSKYKDHISRLPDHHIATIEQIYEFRSQMSAEKLKETMHYEFLNAEKAIEYYEKLSKSIEEKNSIDELLKLSADHSLRIEALKKATQAKIEGKTRYELIQEQLALAISYFETKNHENHMEAAE